MIAPVDHLRQEENDARMRLGVAIGLAAMLAGLVGGVFVAAIIALTACFYVFLGHTALARARTGAAAAAAAAAAKRQAAEAAALAAAALDFLTLAAAARRPAPPPALPSAGLELTPRLSPFPVIARA